MIELERRIMPTNLASYQSLAQLAVGLNFGFSAVATFVIREPDDEQVALEQAKESIVKLHNTAAAASVEGSSFLASQTMQLDQLSSRLLRLARFRSYLQNQFIVLIFFTLAVFSLAILVECSMEPDNEAPNWLRYSAILVCCPSFAFAAAYVLLAMPTVRRIRKKREQIESAVVLFIRG
ncbi:hypothetical protein ACQR1V_32180 [Bradyrhizobium oligotrophicum]|uniref:hypothetical protein n=1 Tax=Bradyrhizobium oligotrophicum TaxID=44255 RepID=UPI003EBB3FAB